MREVAFSLPFVVWGSMSKPEAPPLDGERVAKTLPRSAINMHEALPLDGERVVETPARKAHV